MAKSIDLNDDDTQLEALYNQVLELQEDSTYPTLASFPMVTEKENSTLAPEPEPEPELEFELDFDVDVDFNYLINCDNEFNFEFELLQQYGDHSNYSITYLEKTEKSYDESPMPINTETTINFDVDQNLNHPEVNNNNSQNVYFASNNCNKINETLSDEGDKIMHGINANTINYKSKENEKLQRPLFSCKVCGKIFMYRKRFQDHEKSHATEENNLDVKVPDSKAISNEKPFFCKECSASFSKKYNLTSHMKSHSNIRPYKCPQCPSAFKRRNALHRHFVIHGMVTSHKCQICDKSFYSKELLLNHGRTHTGDRPFKCQVANCNSAFPSQAALSNHNRIKHNEELGLKQFPCEYCDKIFGFQSLWSHHIRVQHSEEKPFKCHYEEENGKGICTRAFKIKRELVKHWRVHTGETPFQCDECGRAFAQQWSFIKHQRSHRDRIKCQFCPRSFNGKEKIEAHLLKVHAKEGSSEM